MRKSASQKNMLTCGQSNKTLQRALCDTPEHFSVGGGHRSSYHFLPPEPGFCPQSLLPFLPNHWSTPQPKCLQNVPQITPFQMNLVLGKFHFPCDCLFTFIQKCPTLTKFSIRQQTTTCSVFQNSSVFASQEKNKEQIITCGISK